MHAKFTHREREIRPHCCLLQHAACCPPPTKVVTDEARHRSSPSTTTTRNGTKRHSTKNMEQDTDRMEQDSDTTAASLATMPFDILHIVLWDEELAHDDLMALRLTCRALAAVASIRLFYRIGISKLKADRDAFLAICHTPHLAIHVRQVEWLEITYHVNLFDYLADHLSRTRRPIPDLMDIGACRQIPESMDIAAFCSHLRDQAEASFWIPGSPTLRLNRGDGNENSTENSGDHVEREIIEAARQSAVAEFSDTFLAAIDLLPNLHTFISRPMPASRIINTDPASYPMTADLFFTHHDPICDMQVNDGFFFFLATAMARQASTITRLSWAEEIAVGLGHIRPFPASAFKGLRSLELCLAPVYLKPVVSLSHFEAACALAAPTLRRLKICHENGRLRDSPGTLSSLILGPALALSPACNLRSLSLVANDLPTDMLFSIFESNANSLRHVYLEDMVVKVKLIRRLAQLAHLKLTTLHIVFDDPGRRICGRALVRALDREAVKPDPGCCSEHDYEGVGRCDSELSELMASEEHPDYALSTGSPNCLDDTSDCQSDAGSQCSEDSLDCRRRTGPRWAWSRFFPADESYPAGVYCFQVPDSHPRGHATECWKFTSRSGKVAYGVDPLTWFGNWDADAGDVEEPTPYCVELRRFYSKGRHFEEAGSPSIYFGTTVWDMIRTVNLLPVRSSTKNTWILSEMVTVATGRTACFEACLAQVDRNGSVNTCESVHADSMAG